MRKKRSIFVIVGSILILVMVAGIFLNYKLDQVVKTLNRPGIVFSDSDYSSIPEVTHKDTGSTEGDLQEITPPGYTTGPGPKWPLIPKESKNKPEQIQKDDIIQGVQSKVNRPIDKKDVIKAGLIIVHRLSWSEIEYMYEVGSKSKMNDEELKRVHKIIRSRLTPDEIKVMQELAHKYGKNLDFLSAQSL